MKYSAYEAVLGLVWTLITFAIYAW